MRNEERHITRCLESLAAQDYPADQVEVIVVDGASEDGSREAAESFQGKLPLLQIVANRGRHTAGGLNIGLAFAQGDIIARVDAHACAAPGAPCARSSRWTWAEIIR